MCKTKLEPHSKPWKPAQLSDRTTTWLDVLLTHCLDRIVSQVVMLAETVTETGKPAGVQGCVRTHPEGRGAQGRSWAGAAELGKDRTDGKDGRNLFLV